MLLAWLQQVRATLPVFTHAESTLHLVLRLRGGIIEPSLLILARKYNQVSKFILVKSKLHMPVLGCALPAHLVQSAYIQ